MIDFPDEGRWYCRNPKCRMKLSKPVANERNAFCAVGCKRQFYRFRCFVCEEPMERKTEEALICGLTKTPDSIDSKLPLAPDRGIEWAIAVNNARIRAPRRVLDAVFGGVALAGLNK
jgi:hypothetical protein